MMIGFAGVAPLLLLGGTAGGALLRRSWLDRNGDGAGLRVAGCGLLLAAALAAMALLGPVAGLAAALTMMPIGVLAVVMRHVVRRTPKAARREAAMAPQPLGGRSRVWRGLLKALLAGPLGMAASLALAFCIAIWAPGAAQTRLAIGVLLVPVLWGIAMTWTLADQRLLRATAVLAGASIAGFGLAWLGELA